MHISDGILNGTMCIGSGITAALLTSYSLKRIKNEDIPVISVITAAFFVATLIHIKIGPSSAHLLLNGLVGIILGIAAFPAIIIALLFQAIMFNHGGITTLGVNAIIMGVPAILVYLIFKLKRFVKHESEFVLSFFSFISGFLSVIFSGIFTALFLMATGKEFFDIARIVLITHFPIAIIEGVMTLFIVVFLQKVKPEMISN